jgi:hypothetical protein
MVSQGAHEYLGTRGIGRGQRQNSKLWKGGFKPISVDRLIQLLAEPRQDHEALVERVATTRGAV